MIDTRTHNNVFFMLDKSLTYIGWWAKGNGSSRGVHPPLLEVSPALLWSCNWLCDPGNHTLPAERIMIAKITRIVQSAKQAHQKSPWKNSMPSPKGLSISIAPKASHSISFGTSATSCPVVVLIDNQVSPFTKCQRWPGLRTSRLSP